MGGQQSFPHLSTEDVRSCLSDFFDSRDSWLTKQDFDEKINKISDWVEEQKKNAKEETVKEHVENVCKIATATTNAIIKFQSGDASDIVSGAMDITSSVSTFAAFAAIGGPIGEAVGVIIGTICSIIGAIFTAMKPKQPSLVEQLAEVVHKELVGFNKRLQDQKFNGLKDRVSEQKIQLRMMERGEELADPNLWNDYAQFMGELSYRFESPLPFKYEKNLTKDSDVADFVTAVATYCQAYNCFMAVLITAKGKFADLKERRYTRMVDLKITSQTEEAKRKLAFLSDKKYLSFLGRLPYEGGKLTKILVLSRDSEARSKVEMVTRGLGLPSLPDLETVERKAKLVSGQSVKEPEPTWSDLGLFSNNVQFINKTKFPMKIICGTVGERHSNLEFTEVVQPGCFIMKKSNSFSVGGYIIFYLDGKVRSDDEPHQSDVTRVIEFAMSLPLIFGSRKINIQDKTESEFSKGQDTYDKMEDGERKTIYWMANDTHHMACGEIVPHLEWKVYGWPPHHQEMETAVLWRFIVRDFDPFVDVVPQDPMDPGNLP